MQFSTEVIEQLNSSAVEATTTLRRVLLQHPTFRLNNDRAKELLEHGFLRRFMTLERCLRNVFRLLPVGDAAVPDDEVRKDAEIAIQSFIFNAFGAIDNLAWIWVEETNLRRPDGRELPKYEVGLQRHHTLVRNSLSEHARNELASFDDWFENLENFRHSLAHRIPLYIPPFGVSADDEAQYQIHEREKAAAMRAGDVDAYERADTAQNAFKKFQPVMTHSFREGAPTIIFHAQLIADFKTVDSIRALMFSEINRIREPNA